MCFEKSLSALGVDFRLEGFLVLRFDKALDFFPCDEACITGLDRFATGIETRSTNTEGFFPPGHWAVGAT
jgi:hypothetical protein